MFGQSALPDGLSWFASEVGNRHFKLVFGEKAGVLIININKVGRIIMGQDKDVLTHRAFYSKFHAQEQDAALALW